MTKEGVRKGHRPDREREYWELGVLGLKPSSTVPAPSWILDGFNLNTPNYQYSHAARLEVQWDAARAEVACLRAENASQQAPSLRASRAEIAVLSEPQKCEWCDLGL